MIKEAQALRLRHELKHSITPADDQILTHRLRKLLPHDEHADSHGVYRVSSLYFDTPDDHALRQKTDGAGEREKFRLRYYNDDLTFLRLEKKLKKNGLCGKRSARLSLEQARRLLDGDDGFLLESGEPLLVELYSKLRGQLLRPKTVVTYDREAFRYAPGNVRVTLDRNLRSGLASAGFLRPDLAHAGMSDGLVVLEVKYDAFLPALIRAAVQTPNRSASAFSKYAVCRRYD